MVRMQRGWSFVNLPVVIDPAAAAVETRLAAYDGTSPDGPPSTEDTRRVVFQRHVVPDALLAATRTIRSVNFYGDADTWDGSRIALGYSATGFLSVIMYREGSDWAIEPVPEEMTGASINLSSVRLVFPDHRTAARFAGAVGEIHQRFIEGKTATGDTGEIFALLIAALMHDAGWPRLVQVAHPLAAAPVL